jgi:hypothetical protein
MNLKGQIGIAAHPDLRLHLRLDRLPLKFEGGARIALGTHRVTVELGEIPLRMVIPFHRHRRVVAGSVGPFRLTIHPTEATLHITEAHTAGTIGGENGVNAELHCQGNCKADIELAGEAPGRILKAAFEGVFEE